MEEDETPCVWSDGTICDELHEKREDQEGASLPFACEGCSMILEFWVFIICWDILKMKFSIQCRNPRKQCHLWRLYINIPPRLNLL